jgi:hypothetical protein
MEAEELIIGDWVMYNLNVFIEDEYEPTKECFPTKINNGEDIDLAIEGCYIPIPLIPEILEKNGFTKSTPPPGIHAICYSLDNKKEKYNLTIANYNKYKRLLLNVDSEDSECFNIKCDYVHELQHALRLCGIKKEIVL